MFTKSPYQVMRIFNKQLLDDCLFLHNKRSVYANWLIRFYKEHNEAKRKYLDWDNDYLNVEDVIDYEFCEKFTIQFDYNDWCRFSNNIYKAKRQLENYNKIIDNLQIKMFISFLDYFQDQASEHNMDLFDLNWCEDCEDSMSSEDSVSVYGGEQTVCQDCRDGNYYYHDGSDQYVHNEDEEYSEYDEGDEDRDCEFEGVLRYDTDVMDYLSKKKQDNEPKITRKTLVGGLECEWEARSSCPSDFPEQIDNLFGGEYCKFKSDGSLRNGFEMVSAPCTLAYHRKQIDKLFDWSGWTDEDKNTYVKAWNTDTCGIHVHLNRASFTGSQIGKILQIVNEEMNRDFIEAVAGRKDTGYSKFSKKSIAQGRERDQNKYEAVNTAHSQSIELRIFRGNATKNGILRVLEFSFALGEYVQQCSFKALHYRDFLKWFNLPRNKADYPYINDWFIRKGYLKDSKSNRLVTNEINEAIDNVVNG